MQVLRSKSGRSISIKIYSRYDRDKRHSIVRRIGSIALEGPAAGVIPPRLRSSSRSTSKLSSIRKWPRSWRSTLPTRSSKYCAERSSLCRGWRMRLRRGW